MKKKLTEIFGLKEGPFDDVSNKLNGATSIARAGGPHSPRPQQGGAVSQAQRDLDNSKPIFAKEAVGDSEMVPVNFTVQELERIKDIVAEYVDDNMRSGLLQKLNQAIGGHESGKSSMTRMSGRLVP